MMKSSSAAPSAPDSERPSSAEAVAALLAQGRRVRPVGGATKLQWGAPGLEPELEISTAGLDRLIEHNVSDLGAGLAFGRVQAAFASRGQRLSLDPPDGAGRSTIGGIVATGDSGPMRHRYGGVRDLILGVRVALPDGTVSRSGSKVIKNVAGYDLAKLMCGALGTLGIVCEVTVRLHPLPAGSVTALGRAMDPGRLADAATAVGRLPLELESLDLRWDGPAAGGALLARAAGMTAAATADAARAAMVQAGLEVESVTDDEALWSEQRERQRSPDGDDCAIVRVSTVPRELGRVLAAAPSAIARAGLGLAWVRVDARPEALAELRRALAPAPCVLLDAPAAMRAAVDPWGVGEGPELALARRVKQRFDPTSVCNAGRFVGGL
jgi:glycolate oxidase FAD binding subunit